MDYVVLLCSQECSSVFILIQWKRSTTSCTNRANYTPFKLDSGSSDANCRTIYQNVLLKEVNYNYD